MTIPELVATSKLVTVAVGHGAEDILGRGQQTIVDQDVLDPDNFLDALYLRYSQGHNDEGWGWLVFIANTVDHGKMVFDCLRRESSSRSASQPAQDGQPDEIIVYQQEGRTKLTTRGMRFQHGADDMTRFYFGRNDEICCVVDVQHANNDLLMLYVLRYYAREVEETVMTELTRRLGEQQM